MESLRLFFTGILYMSLKAKLSIVLKADDVVIAETQDAKLWLKMLTSIIEESAIAPTAPSASHGTPEAHTQEVHTEGNQPHASSVSA